MELHLDLPRRTAVLFLNLAIFYGAFVLASGQWMPTGGLESSWLFSALGLWLFNLLSAPWFMPPRDTLANAASAICILVTFDIPVGVGFQAQLEAIRWVTVFYCAVLLVAALVALVLHSRDQHSPTGKLLFRLTGVLGRSEVLYTPPVLISILGAYQPNFGTINWLLILWVAFAVGRPVERLFVIFLQWNSDDQKTKTNPSVGTIERIDHPNIVRVRVAKRSAWKVGTLHTAALSDGEQQYVLALFVQIQGLEVMGTGLCLAKVADSIDALSGHVYATHDEKLAAQFIENLSGTPRLRVSWVHSRKLQHCDNPIRGRSRLRTR